MMAGMLTGVDRYVMGYVMPKAAELAEEKAGPIGVGVEQVGHSLSLGGVALGKGVMGTALKGYLWCGCSLVTGAGCLG